MNVVFDVLRLHICSLEQIYLHSNICFPLLHFDEFTEHITIDLRYKIILRAKIEMFTLQAMMSIAVGLEFLVFIPIKLHKFKW